MTFISTIPIEVATAVDHELEALIRDDYERTHPNDSFEAFKHRASFDKYDKGQLLLWLRVAAQRRASESNAG